MKIKAEATALYCCRHYNSKCPKELVAALALKDKILNCGKDNPRPDLCPLSKKKYFDAWR
ncbi:MAG: hypothetical protein KKE44_04495 [Proteobacteria bacterium]|nr:hypothetical protein [Pseudomonadota bacterium]MBU1581991.1 hypothetical protein [Pseudomonadota bacterium]MBU2631440.1 hypothetical protein [Pseudomonadota bacterium]